MHGQVVQAVKGQRQHYRPIQSQLTDSHTLIDIVAAILQVYPFDCVYIADLNAITRDREYPHHRDLVFQAMQTFPQLQWWVDAAIQSTVELQAWQHTGARPILASEGLQTMTAYRTLQQQAEDAILSLDFFADGYHGPAALPGNPAQWQPQTIIMSLPKVGARQGPDLARMASMRALSQDCQLYAAGGVRHAADVTALQQIGASGVLLASALHQQQLTRTALQSLQQA